MSVTFHLFEWITLGVFLELVVGLVQLEPGLQALRELLGVVVVC